MKAIIFKIHMCGMSNRTISHKIMIDKLFKTITKVLGLTDCLKNNVFTVRCRERKSVIPYCSIRRIILTI